MAAVFPTAKVTLTGIARTQDRIRCVSIHGAMVVLMASVFFLAGSWTMLLVTIQLIPTQVANYIMNTAELDFGDFWILARGDNSIVTPAVVLLVLLAASYYGLGLFVLCRKLRRSGSVAQVGPETTRPLERYNSQESLGSRLSSAQRFRRQLQTIEDSPLQSLPKLVLQTITLFSYLDQGFPTPLVFSYSTLLCCNWMIAGYCTIKRAFSPTRLIVRVFYCFDLFFAVLAPLQVLVFACYNFEFNRAEFATRTETLASAGFDRTARLFADPTQVSLFRIAFQSLQFTSWWALVIRGGLNILTVRRWWRIVSSNDRSYPKAQSQAQISTGVDIQPSIHVHHRRSHLVGVVFVILGVCSVFYPTLSVLSTQRACKPFSQCQVSSYVLSTRCVCAVFVDRQTRMSTFAEWQNPVDASTSLTALAAAGNLKIVQIINRQLMTLPTELRRCHQLEQLVMIYTKTQIIPEWTKEFSKLKYFHIEGDRTPKRLDSLPAGLFSGMPNLLFVHLGALVDVPFVPELSHLRRLKYLTLAVLSSVTEFPSFDGLISLEQLNIVDAIQVHSLPSITGLRKLETVTLSAREPVCCNGFITGVCDLTDFSCLDRTASGERPVVCSTTRMSQEDQDILAEKGELVCEKNLMYDLKLVQQTFASIDEACGGVMYGKCSLRGITGMCFPSRLTPIGCQVNPSYQAMRRLQIQRKVGDPCDPTIEEWLGCKD